MGNIQNKEFGPASMAILQKPDSHVGIDGGYEVKGSEGEGACPFALLFKLIKVNHVSSSSFIRYPRLQHLLLVSGIYNLMKWNGHTYTNKLFSSLTPIVCCFYRMFLVSRISVSKSPWCHQNGSWVHTRVQKQPGQSVRDTIIICIHI